MDGGKDYIAFLKKEKAPLVVEAASGNIYATARKMTSAEFVNRYFDKVEIQELALQKERGLQKDKILTVGGKEIEKLKQPVPPMKVRL